MTRRVALLVNPTSGKGRGARAAAAAVRRLGARGVDVDQRIGRDAKDALELARRAAGDGYDAVVAVGGDGMANLVLQAVAGTTTPLGLVPAGSGNDIARALGLPLDDPLAAADVVADWHVRTVDAGRAGERWFGAVLSSGFDSAVNERGNAMRWPKGRLRYDLAMLVELGAFRPVRFSIGLDDQVVDGDALLVAVGNGPSYGGGMRIVPAAVIDDGLLDVTVVGPVSRVELLKVFPKVYKGTHVDHPQVSVYRSRRVTLDAAGVTAYVDGERLGPLPLDIACVPGALRVLAPEPTT